MKTSPGITLIELLVTLVIGAFMLLMVGMILVYSQVLWQKVSENSDLQSDVLAAKATLGYCFRNATTDLPGYALQISGGGHQLRFTSVDKAKNTYVLSRVQLSGSDVLYDYWLAQTNPVSHHISFNTAGAPESSVNLMRNVLSLTIQDAGTNSSEISFDVNQQKVTNQGTGSTVNKRTTFSVKGRNR